MFLERILRAKRAEIEARRAERPETSLETAIASLPAPGDFLSALRQPGLSIIAEVKRASPSKGALAMGLDARRLAREYAAGGCAAISVLTDQVHFMARPDDLTEVKGAVLVPVLRKDFLLEEYQLLESRAMGADAVLLIVAALAEGDLQRMIAASERLGLCPLVEVHTDEEAKVAVDSGARVVGINNRDLRTFQVDLETTRRLAPSIPGDVVLVCESGVRGPAEAALAASWGADAVLVGEALVSSGNAADLVREFRAAGSSPAARHGEHRQEAIAPRGATRR